MAEYKIKVQAQSLVTLEKQDLIVKLYYMMNLSAADFTSPGSLSLGFLFGGFYTILGTAFCPFAGWTVINIGFDVHNHGRIVRR